MLISNNYYEYLLKTNKHINVNKIINSNLKKERIYTTLKYSRVPQFDITAGGIASLFAALFGFLITEKFGFELIDSGDFYTIIMYLIFLIFVIRVLLKNILINDFISIISLNNIINFFNSILMLLIFFFKNIFKN